MNGQLRQEGHTSDMVFSIGDLMSHISQYISLEPFDLIMTGTPKGGGPIYPGDVVEAGFGNFIKIKFPVKSA